MQTKIKAQSGFVQIPILITIIAGLFVAGGVGFILSKRYSQNNEVEKEVSPQDEKVVDTVKATTTDEESVTAEIGKLKREIEELKNKQAVSVPVQKNTELVKQENKLEPTI